MNQPASLTIVVAAFNEEAALPALHPRISAVLDSLGLASRILYVDDGSRDGTWAVLQSLARIDPRVSLLRLSRNFGKELALTAGLDLVDTDAALVLDADGQDPPELIPIFIERWRAGFKVVAAVKSASGESPLMFAVRGAYYRMLEARLPGHGDCL